LANQLPPPRRGVDYEIPTRLEVPKPRVYRLARIKTEAVKTYISEMIGKGFISPSIYPDTQTRC
jgi:hypothetical protein